MQLSTLPGEKVPAAHSDWPSRSGVFTLCPAVLQLHVTLPTSAFHLPLGQDAQMLPDGSLPAAQRA